MLVRLSIVMAPIKEQLLHFIWQNKLFNTKDLKTDSGSSLQILDFGTYNRDGGPDFWNAKILIDDIILIGNIELHVHASDWKLHGHQDDQKYKSVILHVVYFNDAATGVPALELNGRIPMSLLERYESMMLSRQELICKNMLHEVDTFTLENWKERMVIERLERKANDIISMLRAHRNDWEQTCYKLLARYFGSHINKEPFELMAQFLPHKILAKHTGSIFQLEALLFGTAGFLEEAFSEEYPRTLQKEYQFLRHKYNLMKLERHQWQFLRIRPVSFPTIRIAWFARMLQQLPLFDKLIHSTSPSELLNGIEASSYWNEHYIFDKPCRHLPKIPGNDFRAVLQVNVFAPLLFAYGRSGGEQKFTERALELLYDTTPEENAKTKIFAMEQWPLQHAFHSQATIELYDRYCTQKRCLECSIGDKILNKTN